jgi:hypothetical protein
MIGGDAVGQPVVVGVGKAEVLCDERAVVLRSLRFRECRGGGQAAGGREGGVSMRNAGGRRGFLYAKTATAFRM